MDFWVACCCASLLTLVSGLILRRVYQVTNSTTRLPILIFMAAYLITTQLGAVVVALFGVEFLDNLGYGLDVATIRDVSSLRYWTLLFAPVIVTPICALPFLVNRTPATTRGAKVPIADSLEFLTITAIFALFAGICVWKLRVTGYASVFAIWQSLAGDFHQLMVLRSEVLRAIGNYCCGIIYTTLPTLSHWVAYRYATERGWAWQLLLLLMVAVITVLSLCTVQKGLLLLYYLSLAGGMIRLKLLSPRTLLPVGAALVCLLTMLHYWMSGEWSVGGTSLAIFFRMAMSFPYYVNLYPEQLPYQGIDLGLNWFGWGEAPHDNIDVFCVMFPMLGTVQGAAAAPAHLRAYSQGGLVWALVTLAIVGLLMAAAGKLRQRVTGPLGHALYMQGLVTAYYLSQTSLVDAVISSYGIAWAVVAIFPMAIMKAVTTAKPQQRQTRPRAAIARPVFHARIANKTRIG